MVVAVGLTGRQIPTAQKPVYFHSVFSEDREN